MYRLLKILSIAVLISVLASATWLAGCASPSPVQAPQVGKQAPDFQLYSLSGQSVSLSGLQGSPVLINFWASWCEPCRIEMPLIQQVYEQWTEKGLVILAINLGENPSRAQRFMESNGLSFTVLLDVENKVALDYNVRGIPVTFFIDKDGIIRDVKNGPFSSKVEIEMKLSKIF